MRYLLASLFCCCLVPLSLAGEATPTAARQLLWKGNYTEARGVYRQLLKKVEHRVTATIGLSRCWRSVGEYDRALQSLETTLKDSPKNADLLAEKADLLFFRGKWDEAEKLAQTAIRRREEQYVAHWVLARLHRDRGDSDKAGQQLIWFIRNYAKHENNDDSIKAADSLLRIGLAAVERARGDPRLNDQFSFVMTEVWGYAFKLHKDFWQAQYERGNLFQEKYNYASATRCFNKALVINPRAAEVLAAKGLEDLRRYEVEAADSFADRALKINPHLPMALRLKADVYLHAGDTTRALEYLGRAEKINPRDELTLARFATCYHLQQNKAKLTEIIQKVEKQNPKCGLFYHELAERLDERKHYVIAEKYFQQALKLRPKQTITRNQLGLLHMRLGREQKAKKLLDAAFKDDPFNVRVYNTLRVLKHLKDYEDIKTEHFLVRYDPKHDKLLARFVAKYLEDIYNELAQQFQYRPKGPILIEILNNHEMFSGRVIALPDLHTIGACTGRMIAMCSTHDKARIIAKPFNWNRVMRHELVHVFNLEQTNFLVPHWFTEGLAVRAENTPMPPRWYGILLKRVPAGDLMNLDNIHLGFIRPGSSEEWHLAYLQSKLYVDYLIKTHGQKAVGGFLDAYGQGLSTASALKKVCNISQENFEKGYRAYLTNLVKNMTGKPAEKELSFKELKQRHAQNPNNPDITAGLAEKYLLLGNKNKAGQLSESALGQKRNHPLASYVQARLLIADKKLDAAKQYLNNALDRNDPHLKVVKLLGLVHFQSKDFKEAANVFELGRKSQPYDNYWLKQLVRCYRQTGDNKKLIEVLKAFAPTETDDLSSRVYVAKLLAKAKRHAEAEFFAREALEIDVHSAEAQELLQEALQAQNKEKELKELRGLLNN